MQQEKEVSRTEFVAAPTLWGKKKRHSWLYLLRLSWVSVKAEEGEGEKVVSRDKVTWVHHPLIKGTGKKRRSSRRGRMTVIKGKGIN